MAESSTTDDLLTQAVAYHQANQFEQAQALYEQLLEQDSQNINALHLLGVCFFQQGNVQGSITLIEKAIAINPDIPEFHINAANSLQALNQYDEAATHLTQAIALNANYAEAHFMLGNVLSEQGKYSDSTSAYDMAIQINPTYKKIAAKEALSHLSKGKLQQGFYLYENRHTEYHVNQHSSFPLWLGQESISGKNLLILYEQGLGDTIQMMRYISLLEKINIACWVQLPSSLLSLMQRSFKNVNWVPLDSFLVSVKAIEGVDYCTYIMSLPLAMKTFHENDIPKHIPYLIADNEKCEYWKKKLSDSNTLKVGLVWRGNPANQTDHYRSMPLTTLEPLFSIPKVQFLNIQKDLTNNEKAILSKYDNVTSYDDELVNFDETAALMMNMDIVISICSSPAHLAGALGKTVWILLPFNADWRWMQNRTDSPWYPTAHLFRQSSPGDWNSIIEIVKVKLTSFAH